MLETDINNLNLNLDLNTLHDEYDHCIHMLHKRLGAVREDRKKSEMDITLLQHRVFLLHNQEKLAMQKFERTKNKLEQILDNRRFMGYVSNLNETLKIEKSKNLEKLKENVKNQRDFQRCSTGRLKNTPEVKMIRHIRNSSQGEIKKLVKLNISQIQEMEKLEAIEKIKEETRRKELVFIYICKISKIKK